MSAVGKDFVFFHIPRTGGSYFQGVLVASGLATVRPGDTHDHKFAVPDGVLPITCLREPYAWLRSCWHFRKRGGRRCFGEAMDALLDELILIETWAEAAEEFVRHPERLVCDAFLRDSLAEMDYPAVIRTEHMRSNATKVLDSYELTWPEVGPRRYELSVECDPGNPFNVKLARECGYVDGVGDSEAKRFVVEVFEDWLLKGEFSEWWYFSDAAAIQWASMRSRIHELQGRTLMCWCPIGVPCHADVLLKFANESTGFFEYRYRA